MSMFDSPDDGMGFEASGSSPDPGYEQMQAEAAAPEQAAPPPKTHRPRQPRMGAWTVEGTIDETFTPEYMDRLVARYVQSPEGAQRIAGSLRPYVWMVVPIGFLFGVAGSWIIDLWSKYRGNPVYKGLRYAGKLLR